MAIWSGLGTGARAALVVAGAGVVAVAGWFTVSGPPQTPVAQGSDVVVADKAAAVVPAAVAPLDAVPVAPVDAEPVAVTEAAPAEVAAAAPADAAPPKPPQFDVVRVEPDGSATIAGLAAPGSMVSLRIDGAEMISAPADASGNFVVLFTLPASQLPRLLTLQMVTTDGATVMGPDTVAIAPTVAAPAGAPEPQIADAAPVDALAPSKVGVEPTAPAALLVTESGVEVLQSGSDQPSAVSANVSVDTISYSPKGEVQLGGRGQAAAFVRLYLDGVDIATVPIAADGQWATVLADVAPGIYTLRVDQIGADGKVTSRFETPFKRETLEVLAAVATPAPAPEPAPVVAEPAAPVAAAKPILVDPAAPVLAAPTVAVPTVAAPAIVVAQQDPMAAASAPAPSVAIEPVLADPAPAASLSADPAPVAVDPAATTVVVPAPVAPVAPVEPAAPEPVGVVAPPPAPAAGVAELAVDAPAAKAALVSITVQPGFTLWGIAKAQMGDGVMYVQVFEANKDKIRDPDLIYPGQVFTLPAAN